MPEIIPNDIVQEIADQVFPPVAEKLKGVRDVGSAINYYILNDADISNVVFVRITYSVGGQSRFLSMSFTKNLVESDELKATLIDHSIDELIGWYRKLYMN